MGREIRRVPKKWEHPKDEQGHFKPMFDREFDVEAKKWIEGLISWENGTNPNKKDRHQDSYYWEYEGDPPTREYYRPKFESEPTCYQIYETVSEGTPVSPVFETKDEVEKWLINQGYSEHAAKQFIEDEWAPSFVMIPGKGIRSDINSFDVI